MRYDGYSPWDSTQYEDDWNKPQGENETPNDPTPEDDKHVWEDKRFWDGMTLEDVLALDLPF